MRGEWFIVNSVFNIHVWSMTDEMWLPNCCYLAQLNNILIKFDFDTHSHTHSHTCRHATIQNEMVRYELYRTVYMCTLYIVQKNVSPLMNCVFGWHTLSFAFVIIPRAVKSTELVTIHYLSFRSCFLCALSHVHCTHTRSWVYKYDIKNENRSIIHYPLSIYHGAHTRTPLKITSDNMNANYVDIFAPFLPVFLPLWSIVNFIANNSYHFDIEWNSNWMTMARFFHLIFTRFFSTFRVLHFSLFVSCLTTSVQVEHAQENKIVNNLDIKWPINSIFVFLFFLSLSILFSSFFAFKFH